MRPPAGPITCVFLIPLFCFITSVTFAETYIAAQGGVTLPQALSSIELTPPFWPDGTKNSNVALKSSYMYGVKVGHFLKSEPWVGVEAEVFTTTPHMKQQRITVTLPENYVFAGTGTRTMDTNLTGQPFRVTTLAFNEVLRYPGKYFQPYVGAGLGIFHAQKRDPRSGVNQYSLRHGFNAQAGMRIKATQHLAFFAEWKFNYTRFHYDEHLPIAGSTVKYNVHHLVAGIGYHF